MPDNINNYDIDLNRVYANLANQDWVVAPQSASAAAYSLHHSIADALTKKIWRSVNRNTNAAVERNGSWANLNFIITGGRGSGKSTFLRYLTHSLINGLPKREGDDYGRRPDIRKLFFCDPTAMSSNEDFLVSIVGALYDMVVNPASGTVKDGVYRITGGEHDMDSGGYHTHELRLGIPSPTCKEMIEGMAKGIKLLKEEESNNSGLDPLSLLKHGFINSNQALGLKSQFDRIVNQIANEYKIDAFLIAIDDADVDSRENRRIMETIRKYLTHPRIIILFTCDMLLANETVREKHFAQFDTQYHDSDEPHQEHRWRIVDRMSAQYIKKIFPLSNLIELTSMNEVLQKSKQTYRIIFHEKNGNPKKVNLRDILDSVFGMTLARNPKNVRIFVSAFLHLPLRSILTTLRCWDDGDFCSFLTKDEQPKLKPAEGDGALDIDALSELVAKSFRVANISELLSWGYTQEDLESTSSYQLSKSLLRHCVLNDDLSNGYRLATFASQYAYQESTLMLASKMAVVLRDLGDVFSCMFFGAFSVHAYKYYQRLVLKRSENAGKESILQDYRRLVQRSSENAGKESILQDYRRYLFSSDNNDAMRCARKISIVYACYQISQEGAKAGLPPSRGVFILSKDEDINVLNMTLNNLYEHISHNNDYESFLAYLLLRVMLGSISNTRNTFYLSLYNVLGFIMTCYKHAGVAETVRGRSVYSQLSGFIRSIIDDEIPNNSAPSWISGFNALQNSDSISLEPRDKQLDSYVDKFVKDVVEWKKTEDADFIKPKAPEVGDIAYAIYSNLYFMCGNIASRLNIGDKNREVDDWSRAHNLRDIFEIGAEYTTTAANGDSWTKDTCKIRSKIGRFVIMKNLVQILTLLTQSMGDSARDLLRMNEYTRKLVNFTTVEEKYRERVSVYMNRIRSYFQNLLESRDETDSLSLHRTRHLMRSSCERIEYFWENIEREHKGISAYVKPLKLFNDDSHSNDRAYKHKIRRAMAQIRMEKIKRYIQEWSWKYPLGCPNYNFCHIR